MSKHKHWTNHRESPCPHETATLKVCAGLTTWYGASVPCAWEVGGHLHTCTVVAMVSGIYIWVPCASALLRLPCPMLVLLAGGMPNRHAVGQLPRPQSVGQRKPSFQRVHHIAHIEITLRSSRKSTRRMAATAIQLPYTGPWL